MRGRNGSGYRGRQTRSRTGKACVAWAGSTTHTKKYYPNAGLDANFCRNPDPQYSKTIWCYIAGGRPRHMWEYCSPLPAPKPVNWKIVANNRYCTGYRKSAFNHRSVRNCYNWVRSVDKEARYFFFRHEGNYHCSPCPLSYTGHATQGTGYQRSKIYIYRILGVKFEVWKGPKRIAFNRYCTGYRKSIFSKRNVNACMSWVKQVDPHARYFFFRHEGNYHCSPCPKSYTGHATTGTGYQNSRLYIYEITGWK
jgi:hypothetical protein